MFFVMEGSIFDFYKVKGGKSGIKYEVENEIEVCEKEVGG